MAEINREDPRSSGGETLPKALRAIVERFQGGEAALVEQLAKRRVLAQLTRERVRAGRTQADIAEAIDRPASDISRFERGDTDPRLSKVVSIADALGGHVAFVPGRLTTVSELANLDEAWDVPAADDPSSDQAQGPDFTTALEPPESSDSSPVRLSHDLRREFFSALAAWMGVLTRRRPERGDQRYALLGEQMERLAPSIFPLLSEPDRNLALDALTGELVGGSGSTVAVRTLLAARREGDLAVSVVSSSALAPPVWASVADWYVRVRDRASLASAQRSLLVTALHRALPPEYAAAFLHRVGPECGPDELAGLIADPDVPAHLRAHLETRVISVYTHDAPHLQEVADDAEFMAISAG